MAYTTEAEVKEAFNRTLYLFELMYGFTLESSSVSGGADTIHDPLVAKVGILPADVQTISNEYNDWKRASAYQINELPASFSQGPIIPKVLNDFRNGAK